MFETLSEKLQRVFKNLRGEGRLNEQHIEEALKEIRMALLEADVNFKVVKQFTDTVRTKSIGAEVLQSLSPGQQVTVTGEVEPRQGANSNLQLKTCKVVCSVSAEMAQGLS